MRRIIVPSLFAKGPPPVTKTLPIHVQLKAWADGGHVVDLRGVDNINLVDGEWIGAVSCRPFYDERHEQIVGPGRLNIRRHEIAWFEGERSNRGRQTEWRAWVFVSQQPFAVVQRVLQGHLPYAYDWVTAARHWTRGITEDRYPKKDFPPGSFNGQEPAYRLMDVATKFGLSPFDLVERYLPFIRHADMIVATSNGEFMPRSRAPRHLDPWGKGTYRSHPISNIWVNQEFLKPLLTLRQLGWGRGHVASAPREEFNPEHIPLQITEASWSDPAAHSPEPVRWIG